LLFLLVIFVFFEIIVMSPNLLEQSQDDLAELELAASSTQESKGGMEQKLQGVHLVENAANEKGWELFAQGATGTTALDWVVKDVKVNFFHENKPSFTVTGEQGEVIGASKDMVIRGNVKTTSTNGYSFQTDTMNYLAGTKMMSSVDEVYMEGPPDTGGQGFKLNGEKLLLDINKNKMSILDKVVASKKVNGKDFNITSVRADFYNTNQEALFSGDVRMQWDTLKIEAPLAQFNYSKTTKALVRIVLRQGVKFSDANRSGSSQELELDLVENKMTMRGQPKVQQGEDEISGQEIVFIDGGKKVKINKLK